MVSGNARIPCCCSRCTVCRHCRRRSGSLLGVPRGRLALGRRGARSLGPDSARAARGAHTGMIRVLCRHYCMHVETPSNKRQAIAATGKPVVVVLIHGGPLAAEWTYGNMPTIVDAHYPGELGGDAVASILFGDVSPSGRLTTTVYPANFVAQRPMTDMQVRLLHFIEVLARAAIALAFLQLAPHGSAPGITHLFYSGPTLWPFGWGLSYTTFSFTWFDGASAHQSIAAVSFATKDAAPPSYAVNVTNTGAVASDVSVLGFYSSGNPGQPVQASIQ